MQIYAGKARSEPCRGINQTEPQQDSSFVIRRRKRFWEVLDQSGELVCLTVYKRGAIEVARRLAVESNARLILEDDITARH